MCKAQIAHGTRSVPNLFWDLPPQAENDRDRHLRLLTHACSKNMQIPASTQRAAEKLISRRRRSRSCRQSKSQDGTDRAADQRTEAKVRGTLQDHTLASELSQMERPRHHSTQVRENFKGISEDTYQTIWNENLLTKAKESFRTLSRKHRIRRNLCANWKLLPVFLSSTFAQTKILWSVCHLWYSHSSKIAHRFPSFLKLYFREEAFCFGFFGSPLILLVGDSLNDTT